MSDLLADLGLGRSGALLGFIGGLGLLLILRGLPRHRRITLEDRLAPYLVDTPRPSTLLQRPTVGTSSALGVLAAPVIADLGRWVERMLGGADSVRRRLLRAGHEPDVERFRAQQVLWGLVGAVGAALVGAVVVAARGTSPVILVLLTGLGLAGGVVLKDQSLSRDATKREAQMLAEFPTIAELLALAVSAGEGAVGALDRVVRLSHGELSSELGRCLADARAGANLPTALQGLADRTGLASLARFVDGMIVAVERGTPLAEVLRAQAQDVREEGRRAVMEEGGKKEIAMMIPVVFLVLPITVLFALFPGFQFFTFRM
ncbi:type II secretion system F family protein [Janibacter sp. G56]|uniref:type II secretion system F family protein n=1 Tax=Janibacter sp. G56 TaxID=3418717 RepID=UPI003D024533